MNLAVGYANELLSHHPRYREGAFLGCGLQGFTILATDTLQGDEVAIKVLRCNDYVISLINQNIQRVQCEASVYRKMQHPHIIQLRGVLEWQGLVGLVMEYAAGGSLRALISARCGLPETAARWFFQQIVMAVDFCHQTGFACQDINLENVLIVNDARTLVKLCISRCSQGTKLHTPPGSLLCLPASVAPEISLSAQSGSMYDGQKADMWSLGVLLFTMLTGQDPFSAQKMSATTGTSYVRSLLMGAKPRGKTCAELDISEQCMELLSKLLQRNPKTRCGLKDVLDNSWFLSDLPPGAMSMNKLCLST